MKTIFTTLCAVTLLANCTNQPNLTVEIGGWGNDTIIVLKSVLSNDFLSRDKTRDTMIAKDNRVIIDLPNTTDTMEVTIFAKSNETIKKLPFQTIIKQPKALIIKTIVFPNSIEKITGVEYENYIEYKTKGNNVVFEHNVMKRDRELKYLIELDSIMNFLDKPKKNDAIFENLSVKEKDSLLNLILSKPQTQGNDESMAL